MHRNASALLPLLALLCIQPSPSIAQLPMNAEPNAEEVRAAIRTFEARNAEEMAKGLSLIRLASFGPKSSAAAGDAMRFLTTANIRETAAISAIAERVVAADANARKLALAELRRNRNISAERRIAIADGIAKGSLDVATQLFADAAWAEPIVNSTAKVIVGRTLIDAEKTALKPRVPLLIKMAQTAKPVKGDATVLQLEQGRAAIQILALLGADAAAGVEVLKKIAADPAHPLRENAARALGTGGLSAETPDQLVQTLRVEATRQQATHELNKRPLQEIAQSLTAALADPGTYPHALDLFAHRIRDQRAKLNPNDNPPATRPASAFAVDATLAQTAKLASGEMHRQLSAADPSSRPWLAENLALVAGCLANDVPEMRELLLSIASQRLHRAGSQVAMTELGNLGESGIAELQKLATDRDPEVASAASLTLSQFPVADPIAYAKQLLLEPDAEAVRRGFQRMELTREAPIESWLLLLDLKSTELAFRAAEKLRESSATPEYAVKIVPQLVKRLADTNVVKARLAAASLAGEQPSAAQPLVALLKRVGHSTHEPAEALVRLGSAGPKALIEFAATLEPTSLQPHVEGNLGTLNPDAVKANLDSIEQLAGSKRPAMCEAAIRLLGSARPESLPAFKRLATSKTDIVRVTLSKVLTTDDPIEAEILKSLSADGTPTVSEAAMSRLCSTEAGRAIVFERMSSTVGAQRKAALIALLQIGRPSDSELAALAALTRDPDVEVRRTLFLVSYGNARVCSRIAFAGLDDTDEACRRSALQAIQYVRQVDSASDLLKLGQLRDRDETLRNDAQGMMWQLKRNVQSSTVTMNATVVPDLVKFTKAAEAAKRRHAAELLGVVVSPHDEAAMALALPAVKALTSDADPATAEAAQGALQNLSNPQ